MQHPSLSWGSSGCTSPEEGVPAEKTPLIVSTGIRLRKLGCSSRVPGGTNTTTPAHFRELESRSSALGMMSRKSDYGQTCAAGICIIRKSGRRKWMKMAALGTQAKRRKSTQHAWCFTSSTLYQPGHAEWVGPRYPSLDDRLWNAPATEDNGLKSISGLLGVGQ